MTSRKETGDVTSPSEPRETSDSGGAAGGSHAPRVSARDSASEETKAERAGEASAERAMPAAARPANYKWVGSQVKRRYDSVLQEPIPDSFMDLLRQAYDRKKSTEKP